MVDEFPTDREAAVQRCRDPGFTPGARHVAPLLALWDEQTGDRKTLRAQRKLIVAALTRGDAGVAEQLRLDITRAPGEQRAMRLRVLGRIDRRVGVAGFDELALDHLDDPVPAVVREAARAIGKNEGAGPRHEERLLGVLGRAAVPERKAAIEALGRIGGEQSRERLAALPRADGELRRVVEEALTLIDRRSGRARRSAIVVDRPLPRPAQVVLRFRSGAGPAVAEQALRYLSAGAGEAGAELTPRGDRAWSLRWSASLAGLYQVRCALDVSLAFPLGGTTVLPQRIIAALTRPEVEAALRAWTDGTPRFRLTLAGQGSRRAVVWEVARGLSRVGSALVNDSRGAVWSIEVDEPADEVLCTPRGADPRFAYRRADVPAASHPTLAALLAWIARPQPGEVVWDPFCGSGAELVECALLEPRVRLWGTDTQLAALKAARLNLDASGLAAATNATLTCVDARTARAPNDASPVSVIVTNPPMGRRVAGDGGLRTLLTEFVNHAAKRLAPSGRVVWVTPLPAFTHDAGARVGFDVEDLGPFDMGGFEVGIQRMVRR